ncbi:MAG: peptidyl-prolyl cis-trans isomerase B (cyclophilin B) [Verrucomicrobiales bacterium]|jgi:peptidyl-prolyl cis-trans isomerase B (cyclophilin B)
MLKIPLFNHRYLSAVFSAKRRSAQFLALITLLLIATTSCTDEGADSQPQTQASKSNIVTLKTNLGVIKVELDVAKAPLTSANFLSYANEGYYDGTIFHRVIPQFMIQGGGFEADMVKKSTNPPVHNEANNGLLNEPYTIAMARTNDPHSATSQFFINTQANANLNHTGENVRGWGYTVFGKVTEGQGVVDAIEKVQTTSRAGHPDVPVADVVIESVTVGG